MGLRRFTSLLAKRLPSRSANTSFLNAAGDVKRSLGRKAFRAPFLVGFSERAPARGATKRLQSNEWAGRVTARQYLDESFTADPRHSLIP